MMLYIFFYNIQIERYRPPDPLHIDYNMISHQFYFQSALQRLDGMGFYPDHFLQYNLAQC